MVAILDRLNSAVQTSFIGRFFELDDRKSTFTTEFGGALATFLSMAYILAVNPRILSDSGGPCIPGTKAEGGIFAPAYESCLEDIKRQYVTATAVASMFGCCFMGIFANLPIALSTGMGMNAYFTYSVVGFRGTGGVKYSEALSAVLIEGVIFLVLALTGARYAIVRLIPEPVRIATPAAIGAFLAHLGLQSAEGIGIVVSDIATAVTLGACPLENRTPIVAFSAECQADTTLCVVSDAYTCDVLGGTMTSGTTWLGILSLMIIAIMLSYKKRSAFICGIALVTFISWFRNTAVTYFPDTAAGNARFEYFKQIVSVEKLNKISMNFSGDLSGAVGALITFLYVDFLDTSGTLLALTSAMGYVNADGSFPRARAAFAADAVATIFGSLLGLSPLTSYIESAAGVEAGARTGLAACIVGFFFLLSIFFAPIISSVPPWATGGALIVVGALMCRSLGDVKWYDISHAFTAFITVIVMPLTYSIAYGLIAGIASWVILQGTFTLLSYVGIKKPLFEPFHSEDALEKLLTKNETDSGDGTMVESTGVDLSSADAEGSPEKSVDDKA